MMITGLSVAAGSDVGRVRTCNEDSYVTGEWVWAVADGMGGQAAGQMASEIATRCIAKCDGSGPLDQLQILALVQRMNQEILAYGVGHPDAAGLGTTIAGVALVTIASQDHWLVFNVGDSRVYRLTEGLLVRETIDHSEAQSLVDQGMITPSQARTHPTRSILTRCLGSEQTPRADIRLVPYVPGDCLLICSDGLTSEVEDDTIERILMSAPSPRDAVGTLVEEALRRGGRDNVTVIVIGIDRIDWGANGKVVEDTLPSAELRATYARTRL